MSEIEIFESVERPIPRRTMTTSITSELEAYKATRHRCPHCRRSFSNRTYAVRHLARCQQRVGNRACKTCAFYCAPIPAAFDGVGCTDPGEGPYCDKLKTILEDRLRTDCLDWKGITNLSASSNPIEEEAR